MNLSEAKTILNKNGYMLLDEMAKVKVPQDHSKYKLEVNGETVNAYYYEDHLITDMNDFSGESEIEGTLTGRNLKNYPVKLKYVKDARIVDLNRILNTDVALRANKTYELWDVIKVKDTTEDNILNYKPYDIKNKKKFMELLPTLKEINEFIQDIKNNDILIFDKDDTEGEFNLAPRIFSDLFKQFKTKSLYRDDIIALRNSVKSYHAEKDLENCIVIKRNDKSFNTKSLIEKISNLWIKLDKVR